MRLISVSATHQKKCNLRKSNVVRSLCFACVGVTESVCMNVCTCLHICLQLCVCLFKWQVNVFNIKIFKIMQQFSYYVLPGVDVQCLSFFKLQYMSQ